MVRRRSGREAKLWPKGHGSAAVPHVTLVVALTPEFSCEAAGLELCCRRGVPRGAVGFNDSLGRR